MTSPLREEPLRCIECGKEITHWSPPQIDKNGNAYWPPETERPTQLDERYSTGYCSADGKMVKAVRARTPIEATQARAVRKRPKKADPMDMWPEGTNFAAKME